jgi:hypothetical protein
MFFQRNCIIVPAILALSIASASSAESGKNLVIIVNPLKKQVTKSDIKNDLVKPGPGTGTDEHGCIPPGIWHAPSGTCITDLINTNGNAKDSKE